MNSSDQLNQLPTDNTIPTHNEIRILNTFFKGKESFWKRIFNDIKGSLLAGILFILFSLPAMDGLIKKFITTAENSLYILLFIKAFFFAVVYYIIKNLWIVRKK